VGGAQAEGGPGRARADVVLGDRDGTTCEPAFTELARRTLAAFGYDVKVNDPYKGVELVRAWSDPARGRHSLQVEVNKRLYLDEATRERHAGFAQLQSHVAQLVEVLCDYARHAARRAAG
jgi:N-formylglutamate amidohydrolase